MFIKRIIKPALFAAVLSMGVLSCDNDDKTIIKPNGSENGYEFVELGLKVKWATYNVGATKPEEYGDYYAWGETETKTTYDWSTYKWWNDTSSTLTKYNTSSSTVPVDDKTVLYTEDDVAHVKWGGSWRMPTWGEMEELINSCTWIWYNSDNTEFNGVAGYKVISNKSGYTDRSIFLPAAECRGDMLPYSEGSYGSYWSSSLRTNIPEFAWHLLFYSDLLITHCNFRGGGLSVRPVCP